MIGTRTQVTRTIRDAVDALIRAADLLDTIERPFADDVAFSDELRATCANLLSRIASREKAGLS